MNSHHQYPETIRQWKLIATACLGVICSVNVIPYYTIGALQAPVTAEFGWTRAQFQFAMLFSSGLGAITAPIVGLLIDKYGARHVGIIGLIGFGLALLVASRMNGPIWTLYGAYSLMALLGAGTIPVTWSRAIAINFSKQRGLALGLALSGTGVCAILAPHYTVWLIEHYGWRGAYVGLALVPLVIAVPIIYFGFHPKEYVAHFEHKTDTSKPQGMTLGQALRGYKFWIILLSILFAYMGFSGIGTNLFPAMTDDGLTQTQAATVLSAFGIAIMFGRVAVGYLVDKFWAPGVAAITMSLPVIGAFIFINDPGFVFALIAAMLVGIAAGAELDLMAFFTARYFGVRHYAKIYGVLYSSLAICSGSAPMLFAYFHDKTQSYDLSFMIASVLFAACGGVVLLFGTLSERI